MSLLDKIGETGWYALSILAAVTVFTVLIVAAAVTDGHAISYVFAVTGPLAALATVYLVARHGFKLEDARRARRYC